MRRFTRQNALLACGELLALLLLAPNRAAAEGLDGVWQGTIGEIEVKLCLQNDDPTAVGAFGAYYALSDGIIISLEPEDPLADSFMPNIWNENTFDGNNAALIFRLQNADYMVGERDGKETASLALRRVPYPSSDYGKVPLTSCGSLAFSAPRIVQGGNTQVIATSWHGRHYFRLVIAPEKLDFHLQSFQIPGTTAAVKRVNTKLAMGFPGLDANARVTDILNCSRSNLEWSGRDGGDTEIRWPEIFTDTILVIGTSYDVYCGCAYPEMSTTWQVINLETGEKFDPRTWLLGDALETLLYGSPSNIDADLSVPGEPSFYEVFLQHYPGTPTDGDDCVDLYRPKRTGLFARRNWASFSLKICRMLFKPALLT
jgi:hypothetical protein